MQKYEHVLWCTPTHEIAKPILYNYIETDFHVLFDMAPLKQVKVSSYKIKIDLTSVIKLKKRTIFNLLHVWDEQNK